MLHEFRKAWADVESAFAQVKRLQSEGERIAELVAMAVSVSSEESSARDRIVLLQTEHEEIFSLQTVSLSPVAAIAFMLNDPEGGLKWDLKRFRKGD